MSTIAVSPTSCPILLFDPPSILPAEDSSPTLRSLITEAYREVTVYHKAVHFLSQLKLLRSKPSQPLVPPKLVLVNIDKNNGTDLHGLDLFRTIVGELGGADSLENDSSFILVAISNDSSPLILCQCMALGAENVLLRPVRKEVVQTLWLNVVRRVTRTSSQRRMSPPVHVRCQNNMIVKAPTPLDFITSNLSAMHAKTDHISSLYLYDSATENPVLDHEMAQPSSSITISCSLQFIHSVEPNPNQRRYLEKKIGSWNFDPRHLDGELDVLRCVALMLENVAEECGGLTAIGVGVDRGILHKFIMAVRSSYHDCNPYHNFYHAVDVLQATYTYLTKMKVSGTGPMQDNSTCEKTRLHQQRVKSLLRPHERFALCIAALCHDLGHPGVNNMFMVNCGSPLAEVYNDVAVLENYHAAALFALLRRDGVSFFGGETLKAPRYKDFRRIVTSAILATDMGRHLEYVKRIAEQGSRFRFPPAPEADDIKEATDCPPPTIPSLPLLEDNDRTLFAAVLLKCADISNASRPFAVAKEWSTALLEEFDMQRRVEMELSSEAEGNSKNALMANQPIGQIMFIDQFVGPLLDAVVGKPKEKLDDGLDSAAPTEWMDKADDLPSSGLLELDFCRHLLQRNRREWERRMVTASDDDVQNSEGDRKTDDACAGTHIELPLPKPEDGVLDGVTEEECPETNSIQEVLAAAGATVVVAGESMTTFSSSKGVFHSFRRSSLPTLPICLRPVPKEVIHSYPGSPAFTKIPLSSPIIRHPNHHTHSHHSHAMPQLYSQSASNNPPVSPVTSRTAPMNAIVMGPLKNFRHNLTTSLGAGAVRYAYGTRGASGCGLSPGLADKIGIQGFGKNGGGRRGSLPNYSSMELGNTFASIKFVPTSVFVSSQHAFTALDDGVEPSSEAVASKLLLSCNLPTAVPATVTPQQRCEQNSVTGTQVSGDSINKMPMPGEMLQDFMCVPNNSEFSRVRRRSIPPDWPL